MRSSQTFTFRFRCAVFSIVAALGLSAIAGSAAADAWGASCGMGTLIATPVTLSIDDATVAHSPSDSINTFASGYVANVCRDSANHSYIITVTNILNPRNYLDAADADKTFKVTFTPQSGDVPLIAEGHGRISGLDIGSAPDNVVTLTVKPIDWSDIHGSDCGSPMQCVAVRTTADEDMARDIRVGIRYAEGSLTGAGSEGFRYLQGMSWSAGAYYFWLRTDCPAVNGSGAQGISLEMGGPHFKSDGTTVNAGFANVVIPASAVATCFGGTASDFVANSVVTRTESGTTTTADSSTGALGTGIYYTVANVSGDVVITVPTVTFSQPTYRVTKARKTISLAKLAKAAKVATKPGGRVAIRVKSAGSLCLANTSKLFVLKKGTCKVVITTYRINGAKYRTKSYSYKVK